MGIVPIVIMVVLLVALVAAFVAFIKTPKDKRYILIRPDPNADNPEYAPEYSMQERIRFVLIAIFFAVPLYAVTEFWFFDWLAVYSEHAHCYQYGSVNGVELVMYGIFVGIPLSAGLLLLLFEGRKAINVVKLGQFPLPGQKVLRPTKYKYGAKARAIGLLVLASILFFIGISLWGYVVAEKLTQEIPSCSESLSNVKTSVLNSNLKMMAGWLHATMLSETKFSVS